MDYWRWWCEIIIVYFECVVSSVKKLSGGMILLLQESLFIIQKDGAINECEGTFLSNL
jgi:hypothetical protein